MALENFGFRCLEITWSILAHVLKFAYNLASQNILRSFCGGNADGSVFPQETPAPLTIAYTVI